jgi:hypothetical protein
MSPRVKPDSQFSSKSIRDKETFATFNLIFAYHKLSQLLVAFILSADILCRLEAFPEELHPPIHRHQELVPVPTMESTATGVRVHSDQPVLRLLRDGHHPAELCVPGQERASRGGGILLPGHLLHRDVHQNHCQRLCHQQIHVSAQSLELARLRCHHERLRHNEHG